MAVFQSYPRHPWKIFRRAPFENFVFGPFAILFQQIDFGDSLFAAKILDRDAIDRLLAFLGQAFTNEFSGDNPTRRLLVFHPPIETLSADHRHGVARVAQCLALLPDPPGPAGRVGSRPRSARACPAYELSDATNRGNEIIWKVARCCLYIATKKKWREFGVTTQFPVRRGHASISTSENNAFIHELLAKLIFSLTRSEG